MHLQEEILVSKIYIQEHEFCLSYPCALEINKFTFALLKLQCDNTIYCKKRIAIFRPQPGCHITKLSLALNN
jgi:hypothetical protein